jgi:ribulose-phosphate 3-epimerase
MAHPQNPILIAPSILSANFARLAEALRQLETAGADWVHVDVMDGHFVPNLTIGAPVVAALAKETHLPLDVHLMIENPERYISDFAKAGAKVITVHQEACTHLHRTLNQIREAGCLAGVSLNPATPVHTLEDVLDEVDLILVMSVNPGFGGQSFIPRALERIKKLKSMRGNRPIRLEVDGGISPTNVEAVLAAGADTLVAGSAVFNAPDMAMAIRALRGDKEALLACKQLPASVTTLSSSPCG